jgi:peptidyl-prolyl cis-trans isomerase B (cyclophilin B)
MKRFITAVLCLLMILPVLAACEDDSEKVYFAEIDIKDYGVIKVQLNEEQAPITVENFVKLAKDGFYDGLTFHRIIKGFMMQGGDPNGNGTGGASEKIKGEFFQNKINNTIKHQRGVISMARSQAYDSASSQFFIMHQDAEQLDGLYAAFGYVIEGMDVVDKICESAKPVDGNGSISKANQPVINTIKIYKDEPIIIDGKYTAEKTADESSEASAEESSDVSNEISKDESQDESQEQEFSVTHTATIKIKDYGTIKLDLYGKEAPITVANFVKLANEGFYNGLTFHRIINGFMMQGGDPDGNGTGGSDEEIKGEFSANGVKNPIKHKRGVISMARSNAPNSASSQFFIMHKTTDSLDGYYAAFGMVTEGIDVVDKVCTTVPVTDKNGTVKAGYKPVIESITVEEVK